MNEKKKLNDDALIDATRHAVSRRQEIAPTPRDTMAVIMKAAEQEGGRQGLFARGFPVLRWASVAALALVLAVGVAYLRHDDAPQSEYDAAAAASPLEDLGLDVVAWDMEIAALLSDLEDDYAALSSQDFEVMDL